MWLVWNPCSKKSRFCGGVADRGSPIWCLSCHICLLEAGGGGRGLARDDSGVLYKEKILLWAHWSLLCHPHSAINIKINPHPMVIKRRGKLFWFPTQFGGSIVALQFSHMQQFGGNYQHSSYPHNGGICILPNIPTCSSWGKSLTLQFSTRSGLLSHNRVRGGVAAVRLMMGSLRRRVWPERLLCRAPWMGLVGLVVGACDVIIILVSSPPVCFFLRSFFCSWLSLVIAYLRFHSVSCLLRILS